MPHDRELGQRSSSYGSPPRDVREPSRGSGIYGPSSYDGNQDTRRGPRDSVVKREFEDDRKPSAYSDRGGVGTDYQDRRTSHRDYIDQRPGYDAAGRRDVHTSGYDDRRGSHRDFDVDRGSARPDRGTMTIEARIMEVAVAAAAIVAAL